MNIRWRYFIPESSANGPGKRCVIWFQGCSIGCEGCCNPDLQDPKGGRSDPVETVFEKIRLVVKNVDGITISGGEPFQQPEALCELVRMIKAETTLSVLVFSGYQKEKILSDPKRNRCLPWIDAILYGPYIQSDPPALERFCASGNQGLWLLSDRFQAEDFSDLPVLEFLIGEKGELIQSGLYGINFIEK